MWGVTYLITSWAVVGIYDFNKQIARHWLGSTAVINWTSTLTHGCASMQCLIWLHANHCSIYISISPFHKMLYVLQGGWHSMWNQLSQNQERKKQIRQPINRQTLDMKETGFWSNLPAWTDRNIQASIVTSTFNSSCDCKRLVSVSLCQHGGMHVS